MALCVRNTASVVLLLFLSILSNTAGVSEVIFAVNAGGSAHIDTLGIIYEEDPLEGKIGTSSDFGRHFLIRNVPLLDQVLYQTERFHHSTFGYDFPLKGDGEYLLVLKFCEVFFDAPRKKVFDVVLNGELKVIRDLDIFHRVGRGASHNEHIHFSISGDSVLAAGGQSLVKGDTMRVDFVKGARDNPKVNALYVVKVDLDEFISMFYSVSDISELRPGIKNVYINKRLADDKDGPFAGLPRANKLKPKDEMEYDGDGDGEAKGKHQPSRSESKNFDPYADDTSYMIPIFVAFGAAIPIVFRLCQL